MADWNPLRVNREVTLAKQILNAIDARVDDEMAGRDNALVLKCTSGSAFLIFFCAFYCSILQCLAGSFKQKKAGDSEENAFSKHLTILLPEPCLNDDVTQFFTQCLAVKFILKRMVQRQLDQVQNWRHNQRSVFPCQFHMKRLAEIIHTPKAFVEFLPTFYGFRVLLTLIHQ